MIFSTQKRKNLASYMWRKYADYVYTKWERMILWNMVEPYTRPKLFTPLVTIYVAAFYTGVVASAVTEQLYKEKYWEDHPGHSVPLMKPKFYGGPWKVQLLDSFKNKEGKTNHCYRIFYRSMEWSLTNDEINKLQDAVIELVKSKLKVVLR